MFKKMFHKKVLLLFALISLSQAQNPPKGSSCCSRLRFDSTGNLADSGQNHIIGNYIYISDGPDGYWNYEQEEPNQFGNKLKLYYYPPVGVWYFGDDLDTNMGYALNKGDAQCPEGLQIMWQWWNWEEDEWTFDPEAKATCSEVKPTTTIKPTTLPPPPTTLPPTPDFCVAGYDCNDCSLTVGYQGVTYCCNNDCNSGCINVDPTTNPLCQCGHE